MAVRLAVIIGYFVILLAIGLWARRRARGTSEDYFLASRSLSPVVLFLTMAATNFSAFTVFGFSGAGWEAGYSYYPVMAFGTGFMALTFLLIGRPAWRMGVAHGLLTPPEMVYHVTGSRSLRILFFLVMAVFTVPYLAMQPIAAGYALNSLLGIPYFAGAAIITAVMLLYT
ncbi:sodium:solute symporter family protein, partial [Candidatus Bipolaricaulota bacterium]